MELIFWGTFALLLFIACIIGIIALYLQLKRWAWEEMDINLPPKTKPTESYWEFFEGSVTPTYACNSCNYKSDEKFWHCPCCGKHMKNHNIKIKEEE
ncbi:MAG: hypothetical protein IJ880_01830 [Bacilli bacterium]|nr:hypothetical protein [Bacilli bacterium]